MTPENYLPLALLAVALLWALALASGARGGSVDNWLAYCLRLSALLCLVAGGGVALGLLIPGLFIIVVPIYLVVVLGVVQRYRSGEARTLLWTISHAAMRQVGLSTAVRAFAHERSDETGLRAWQLADHLDAGMPVDVAMRRARMPVSLETLVALRSLPLIGQATTAIHASLEHEDRLEATISQLTRQLVLVMAFLTAATMVFTFLTVWIVPTLQRVFLEFEVDLPAQTQLLVTISETTSDWAIVLGPVLLLLAFALAAGVLYHVGWLPWRFPGISRLRLAYDRTVLLRMLAAAVAHDRPLALAIDALEPLFPTTPMRRRLVRAAGSIRKGADWRQALFNAGLLQRRELAALQAAERTGNLAWTLETLADIARRRIADRLQLLLTVTLLATYAMLSVFVLLVTLGIYAPLVELFKELA